MKVNELITPYSNMKVVTNSRPRDEKVLDFDFPKEKSQNEDVFNKKSSTALESPFKQINKAQDAEDYIQPEIID